MNKTYKSTRIKLTVGGIILIFIEAVIKSFLAGFPFTEAVSIQSALIAGYLGAKTTQH